jgi:hypothetical protein
LAGGETAAIFGMSWAVSRAWTSSAGALWATTTFALLARTGAAVVAVVVVVSTVLEQLAVSKPQVVITAPTARRAV